MGLAIVVGILALAHFISGVAGFGATLFAVPSLVFLYGTESLPAIVLLALCSGMAQCLLMTYKLWQQVDVKLVGQLMLGALFGMPIGIFVARSLPKAPLLLILAACIGIVGLRCFSRQNKNNEARDKPVLAHAGIGLVSGSIHGAFGTGGAVLIGWMRYVRPEKNVFRASLMCCWVVLNGGVIGLSLASGWPQDLKPIFLMVGIPIVLLATYLGDRLSHKVPQQPFTYAVGVLLLATCLSLILSALT